MKPTTLNRPIYLDYMASTPVDSRVVEKMLTCLTTDGYYANPSSNHQYGFEAAEQIELARQQIADLVHADAKEIIFTSGATEANNLAIKGAAHFYQRKGRHIITMNSEHKAVIDPCRYLMTEGFDVTFLNPQANGLLDLQQLKNVLRPETVLVSIMHVNNETGIIQDIQNIGKILKEQGVLLHVDAAQSAGKIAINLKELLVDLMSFSSHKIYGPKGIGALFIRQKPRIRLSPLIHGGGQESGVRSGTVPTHQVVGMGKAFEIAAKEMQEESQRILLLRERLWNKISMLGGVHINGSLDHSVPHCLNIRVDGVDAESLVLSLRNLAISTGSACNAASHEPSHVLMSMGLTRAQATQSLRISFGRMTTNEEIDGAIAHLSEQITRLRNMSPVWERIKNKLADRL